jgi:hypothetical protein
MVNGSILNVLEKQLAHLLKCRLLPELTYLAGGTAVYFYLNHRVSIDLDFFTTTPFNAQQFVHKIINPNNKKEKFEKKEWQKIKKFFQEFIK